MNITKQRLEQLIKEEYNIFLDELPPEELEELLFEESEFKPGDKKFFSTPEEAREYARNVERAREQGIDPDKARTVRAGFGMVDPFAKYREKIKTKKIAQDRVERRKQLAALRKADQAEAPMTPDDSPMSIDRNMLDAPTLSEDPSAPDVSVAPVQARLKQGFEKIINDNWAVNTMDPKTGMVGDAINKLIDVVTREATGKVE